MLTYLCAMRHPETGAESPGLVLLPQLTDFDEPGKNLQVAFIRLAIAATMSVGVISVMETWYVQELSLESIDEWRGRLDEHPNRREGLAMFVEHMRFGTRCWRAEITRETEDGPPTLGEWNEVKDANMKGRFIHLLPQVQ